MKSPTTRPIIKGLFQGIAVPTIIFGLFFIGIFLREGKLELVGFGMVLIFMGLLVLCGLIFLTLFLKGVINSCKNYKKPWVFLFLIIPAVVIIGVIFLLNASSSPIIGY